MVHGHERSKTSSRTQHTMPAHGGVDNTGSRKEEGKVTNLDTLRQQGEEQGGTKELCITAFKMCNSTVKKLEESTLSPTRGVVPTIICYAVARGMGVDSLLQLDRHPAC